MNRSGISVLLLEACMATYSIMNLLFKVCQLGVSGLSVSAPPGATKANVLVVSSTD